MKKNDSNLSLVGAGPMESCDLSKLNNELLAYSLQPQRFPLLVKLVRKILWRFIRPFHFYQIQEMSREQERQIQEIKQVAQKQDEKIKNFFASAASRSENIPLINRIAYLESEIEGLKTSLGEIKNHIKIV